MASATARTRAKAAAERRAVKVILPVSSVTRSYIAPVGCRLRRIEDAHLSRRRASRRDCGADGVDLVAPAGAGCLRLRDDEPPGLRAADRERVPDRDAGAGGRRPASAAERLRPRRAVHLDRQELVRRRRRLLDEDVAAEARDARSSLVAGRALVPLVALRSRVALRARRAGVALELPALCGSDVEQRQRRVLHLGRVHCAILELDRADAPPRQDDRGVARPAEGDDQRDAGDDERGRRAVEPERTHANPPRKTMHRPYSRSGRATRGAGTTKARRSGPSSSRMSSRESLEPVNAAQLLPRGAEEVRLGVEAALLGARVAAAADGPAGRRGVPGQTIHACTSRALSAGGVPGRAGARVMSMSPLTVFARISISGPSAAGS